ncbi:MAG TPA: histidine kinase [Bryobacteraceae bacterium]|nr:histidine kinase [Bryobacteraceae bacterium]
MLSWTIWALLVPLVVQVDRMLPVPREALVKRLVFHVPLSLVFTTVKQLLYYATLSLFLASGSPGSRPPLEALRASFRGIFQSSLLSYWIVLLIYYAFDYQRHIKERELQQLELERQISESRLETLRAQLRPNFLFNALGSISAYLDRSPRTARRMLGELGELLRLGLAYSEEHEVPLAQEIGFLEHYLEIQRAKLNGFGTSVKPDPDVLHALVPTFILQPLVEAAILHGMTPDSKMNLVEVRAWRSNGQLHLRVQDDGPGLPPGWDGGDSLGIGVSNTRERLKRLYGDVDQTFEIFSEPGKGIRVDLSIPFREG